MIGTISTVWRNLTASQMSAKLLIVSSVVTVIGFSAICASIMLDMRRGAEDLARQTMGNLAATIDAEVSRNIELYDLSLRTVVGNMALPELSGVGKSILHLILFDHAATARHFGPIQVFDANGDLSLDASTLTPVKENRADEEYFKVHRDNPDLGLFISRPMLRQSTYSVVLSRRISGPDGNFAGVVVGSIRFGYFHDLFERLRLGEGDVITVTRRDGMVVMRRPFDLDVVGKTMKPIPDALGASVNESGWFTGTGETDGVKRMFVWSEGNRPLVVLVGKPWTSILGLWRREAVRIGAIMLALAVFVTLVTLVLVREIGRRARAERQLEELATTDPLTGLINRRKFDRVIDEEWRRAQRQGRPVALLMLDADHFKTFNDSFGHQAGDEVLIGIALCIADSVHRAGDCAARYGGEEFAVLLPGMTSAAALEIAELIRIKVFQWGADQPGVTISVGVASLTPVGMLPWSALLTAADKALYAAKAAGRNRSVASANNSDLTLVA
jgi:diguanylate cyclase (GGDEF)-like protein